jgi:putative membrane protein
MSCKIHTAAAFAAALSVATWASAQSSPATAPQSSASTNEHGKQSADSGFAKEAAEGGLAEVQLGKLATEKASNGDVKKFGQMMVDDHSKANDQLSQIAQSKHLTVPQKISSKDQATYDRLSGLTGDAFDRAYIRLMVEDHKKDVQEFKKQSTSGADPELKQFASTTLPTLEKHLQDAQSIATRLGQTAATSGTDTKEHATDRPGHPKATTTPTPPQR